MSANNTMVLRADHGHVNKEADKTKKKYEDIGKGAKTVGQEMAGWSKQAANTLFGVAAILATVQKVAQKIKELRQDAVRASETSGEEALSRGKSIRKLGLDKLFKTTDTAMDATKAQNFGSQSAINSFLQSASGLDRKPKPMDVMAGVRLIDSGMVDESEVMAAMKRPGGIKKLEAEASRRLGSASDTEMQELFLRKEKRDAEFNLMNAQKEEGALSRAREILMLRQRFANPRASLLRDILGDESGTFSDLFGGSMNRDFSAGQSQQILEENKKQTEILRQGNKPRPNLNPNAGGDG